MGKTRRYLGFDIETATRSPEDGSDWRSCRPLGISCAATLLGDSQEPLLWHGGDRASPGDRLTKEEASNLVRYLEDHVAHGYTLLTWNPRFRRPSGTLNDEMAISERQDGKLTVVAIRASPSKKPTFDEAACFASRNHTRCSSGLIAETAEGAFPVLGGPQTLRCATRHHDLCQNLSKHLKPFPSRK
jgi:hypothetical protein